MALDAAMAEGVPQTLIDIYVAQAINHDIGWYVESGLVTRARVAEMENEALTAAIPKMDEWVKAMNAAPYIRAPILSDEAWEGFTSSLHEFGSAPDYSAIRAML